MVFGPVVGSRGGILTGNGQISDRVLLDMGRRDGVLMGHGQLRCCGDGVLSRFLLEKRYTDWT